jgi:hypothetical protein
MTVAERSMERAARWSKDPVEPMRAPEMSIDPLQSPLYPVTSAPGSTAAARAAGTAHVGKPFEALYAEARKQPVELEPGPTDDALTAVQVAAQAYEVLRQHGRELRFQTDDGVMRIDVYDGMGRLVRTIPPNEALALAAGEASWQA